MKARLIAAFAALLVLAPGALAAPMGVALAVKIARVVTLPAGEENVTVPVALTLSNPSERTVTLQVANRCEVHIWKVMDAKGDNLENHGMCYMIYMPQYNTLAPGERQTEEESISLQAAQFHEGETYTLHYRFWNIFAEAEFKVQLAR